jgi:glucoamylase
MHRSAIAWLALAAGATACGPTRGGAGASGAPASNARADASEGASSGSSGASPADDGPGARGLRQTWPAARKSFLGTLPRGGSHVYFTGQAGSVSEVFYPRPDAVQSVGLEFLIAHGAGGRVEVERELPYVATRPEPRSMRWRVSTESAEHGWRLTKDIFTDPARDALIVVAELALGSGRSPGEPHLYVAHDPALQGTGAGDSSRVVEAQGHRFLVAREGDRVSALGISVPWALRGGEPLIFSAFAGEPGSRADLIDGDGTWGVGAVAATAPSRRGERQPGTLERGTLERGNVEQVGEVALDPGGARRFATVLAFGASEREAIDTAAAVLDDDWEALARRYDQSWKDFTAGLDTQGGSADDQYYLAAMTLESMRDEASGALVAGMGTPWGPTRGDDDNGGYHLVWPRDLFKFGNALITAGDLAAGLGAVQYLFGTLVQTEDCGQSEADTGGCARGYSRVGRFPQNAWIDGTPYWTSTQLDEQAMPIALAWRVYERGDTDTRAAIAALWPRIRSTAEYILTTGPWTLQERWEETSGYSPSSIAAAIAGLVAAAELARAVGDPERAGRYLAVADRWEDRVTAWTFTTTGPYGDHRYYLRLNPSRPRGGAGPDRFEPEQGPDAPLPITIGNGGGVHDQREIVDGGFLELVRLGVKAPTDPSIVGSLREYDAILKQSIAGKGSAWFRYNFDGYGEAADGSGWQGTGGHGRLWPIFTAERGMYEIARAANGASGAPFLGMLRAFATPEGFIPEQVWNTRAVITGQAVDTPPGREPGTPTDSIAPLSWAMGEYMTLLASVRAGRVVDMPESVCRRYDTCAPAARSGEVSARFEIRARLKRGERVYIVGSEPALGGWQPALGAPAHALDRDRWRAVVELPASTEVEYAAYVLRADGTWQEEVGGRRPLRLPDASPLAVTRAAGFGADARR